MLTKGQVNCDRFHELRSFIFFSYVAFVVLGSDLHVVLGKNIGQSRSICSKHVIVAKDSLDTSSTRTDIWISYQVQFAQVKITNRNGKPFHSSNRTLCSPFNHLENVLCIGCSRIVISFNAPRLNYQRFTLELILNAVSVVQWNFHFHYIQ